MTKTSKRADPSSKRKRTLLRLLQALLLAWAVLNIYLAVVSIYTNPPESFLLALLGVPALLILEAIILLIVRWGLGQGVRTLYWLGLAFVLLQLVLALVTIGMAVWLGVSFGALEVVDVLISLIAVGLFGALRKQFGVSR